MVSGSDYTPEMLRGNTESLLLALIEALGGAYGYRLIKEMDRKSQGFFRFKEGTIYPALRKLENEGLIEGEWQRLPSGTRERRFYRITARGQAVLTARRATWQGFIAAMNLILNQTP